MKLLLAIKRKLQTYQKEVAENKKYPFFNKKNTPKQWAGKVVKEFQNRGPFEGLAGIYNPYMMNPYIQPVAERVVSKARVKNYKMGRPNKLVNEILGQTDAVYRRLKEANIPGKDYGPEVYPQ